MSAIENIYSVAVIGAGEVAMTVHLPTLSLCSHMFRTVALVDISKDTLAHCATKFHVPHVYTDVGEMLEERTEVDAVMIMNANEYHVAHTVQCLKAGRHVFIEKPVSLTLQGFDEIIAAEQQSGKTVFVGYMRRYAEAFLRVKSMVQKVPKDGIAFVRVRDIIGVNSLTAHEGGCFPKTFSDFPANANEERLALSRSMLEEALCAKVKDPRNHLSWRILNALASHDLSAMRELFGMPQKVLCACRNAEGKFITAMLQYSGFNISLELGVDMVKSFDAHIEIFTKNKRIRLHYDNPYIKGLPVTATILSTNDLGDHCEEKIRPTYEDPYTQEYKAWHAVLSGGQAAKTSTVDAKLDVEIMTMIIDAMV